MILTKNITEADFTYVEGAPQNVYSPFYIYYFPIICDNTDIGSIFNDYRNRRFYHMSSMRLLHIGDLRKMSFYQDGSLVALYMVTNADFAATIGTVNVGGFDYPNVSAFYSGDAYKLTADYSSNPVYVYMPYHDKSPLKVGIDPFFNKTYLTCATLPTRPAYNQLTLRNRAAESKLFTYPYMFYELNDFHTEPQIYKNELFDSDVTTAILQTDVTLSENPKIENFCVGYNNDNKGFSHGCIDTSVKDLATADDAYLSYIKNNKASMISSMAVNALGAGASITATALSGGALLPVTVGAAAGGIGQIISQAAKMQDIKRQDDTVKSNGSNLAFDIATDRIYPRWTVKFIRQEYKEAITDFWNVFGYPIGKITTIDTTSRYYFNYIKTIGVNITGNIPQEHINLIKQIYDNGVTIWHYRDGIMAAEFFKYNHYENAETIFTV
jgi:hypothetical protein